MIQKGLAPILIVLLIAAAIGGYLVYSGKITLPQKQIACILDARICPDGTSVGRSGPKCEFTLCPSPVTDETADWKTYTNSQYKFEIKYPVDWKVKETTYSIKDEGWLFYVLISSPDGNSIIDITVSADPNNEAEKLSKQATRGQLNQYPAWVQEVNGKGKVYTLSSVINTQIIQISAVAEQKTFDQILSTFKFTN